MNILITGSSGFVGKQVINAFNEVFANVTLHLVLRPKKGNFNKKSKNIKSIIFSENIFKESSDWWAHQCANIDIFINLAWYAEPGKYLDSPLNKECHEGTINMAIGAAKSGVRKFVGIGTCFEYKFSTKPLDINSPLDPKSAYAKAKVNTFHDLEKYFKKNEVDFLWYRLFYLFGEGEDERRLVPYIRKSLSEGKKVELTSGEKIKDYLNIKDAGTIIAKLAMNKHTGAYNVCSGKGISIRSLAESIADEYERRDLLHFGEHEITSYDPPYIVGKKTDPKF